MAAVKLAHEANGVDEDVSEIPAASEAPRERPAPGRTSTIFVSLGHAAKIRPQDLVGAITGETSLSGRQIGAIEITHKFSTVEIPQDAEADVISALSKTLIKGRKARVERYKPPSKRDKK